MLYAQTGQSTKPRDYHRHRTRWYHGFMSGSGKPLLDYEHRADLRPMSSFPIRLAWVLGTAPMIVGCLITLLYVLTWETSLTFAGLFCILGGLAAAVVAVCSLGYQWLEYRRRRLVAPKTMWLPLLAVVLNFPACWICIEVGFRTMSIYEIVLENNTSAAIVNVTITGTAANGVTSLAHEDAIAPGGRVSWRITPPNDGQIRGAATMGGQQVTFLVDDYVSASGFDPVRRTVRFPGAATRPIAH